MNDPSVQAAAEIDREGRAETLRQRVLSILNGSSLARSADELAVMMGEPFISVRPRLSELRATGKVRDSGQRGKTAFGKSCIKWEPVDVHALKGGA